MHMFSGNKDLVEQNFSGTINGQKIEANSKLCYLCMKLAI